MHRREAKKNQNFAPFSLCPLCAPGRHGGTCLNVIYFLSTMEMTSDRQKVTALVGLEGTEATAANYSRTIKADCFLVTNSGEVVASKTWKRRDKRRSGQLFSKELVGEHG